MNARRLLSTFGEWRASRRELVLATVCETSGSTYSKAGAQMLIDADANFQGMLSGGCLEGDLAERAARVLASDRADIVTYDLGANDSELWGLGVGCDGRMRILLQPLRPASDYQPFAAIADVYAGDEAGAVATVLQAAADLPAAGAAAILHRGAVAAFGIDAPRVRALQPALAAAQRDGSAQTVTLDAGDCTVLVAGLRPPPHVLVLGGGLDAQPVVRLLAELGWRISIQDHRPAYIERGDFGAADRVLNCPAERLASELDLSRYDAAIVMSHHLVSDRCYLQQLAGTGMAYIGLLGPPDRRRRLLAELGDAAAALEGRLHGPAGIDIGGRGPAAIALSIVAELHQVLVRGDRP